MKLMVTAFLVFLHKETDGSHRPMDLMADLTNDLGVCILQVQSSLQYGNIAFSPYGLASMSVLLFEGATGNTALEIMRVMKLPWNTLVVRIGFRDINRHLKTYFRSDGFLRGLIMSRDNVCFHASYQKILRLYGFDEPDTALTYPCTGFVPYSPPSTIVPPTTTELASIPSPGSTGENTTKSSTDEVVTELTQTSQTVTVRNNSTNLQTLEAATSAFTQAEFRAQTESILSTGIFETGDTMTTPAKFTLDSNTPNEELTTSSVIDETFTFSNTIATMPVKSKAATLTAAVTEFSSFEEAESNVDHSTSLKPKISPITTSTTVKPSTSTISHVLKKPSNKTDQSNFPIANNASSFPNTNKTYYNADNQTKENNFKEKGIFSSISNSSTSFDQDFAVNFTAFTFTPIEVPTTIEPFNSDQFTNTTFLESSTGADTSFFSNTSLNFSSIDLSNITVNYTIPTIIPLLNDTSVTETDDIVFSSFTSPFSSFEKFDFDNSTFFNTLVNFIDSTTETMKDLIGFGENSTNIESTTFPYKSTDDKMNSNNLNLSSIARNVTSKLNASIPVNVTAANINDSRSFQVNLNSSNVNQLRKESIRVNPRVQLEESASQESNENFNRVTDTAAETNLTPLKYVNVVALKQRKTISSKYDIRRTKGSRFVRSVLSNTTQSHNNTENTVGDFAEKLKQLRDNLTNVTLQYVQEPGNNFSSFSSSIQSDSKGQIVRSGPSTFYSDIHDFSRDMRSTRSFGYNSFNSPTADWFATPDQNVIRIPVFSYVAMLPFAYIEEIKSKVLEIPLDDYNYSLLLILPAPEFGVNQLLNSLTRWSLRRIWNHLRATPVYSSIPKFSIVSHVNLRPALYNLGVRDVFHRYRADLSLMSPDSKLFVRSIEQVVTVYVDKYPSSVYPVPERYVERHFIASHPFLYFVLDRDSGVSLVAGILSNPSKHI